MIVNFDTFTDTDTVESFIYQTPLGVPIAINPLASLRFQARIDPADPTVLVDCSTLTAVNGNGRILVTSPAGGAFTLTIPISVLLNLLPGTYYHSLVLTDPVTLLRDEVWRGTITHAAGPTRWNLGTL